MRRKYFPNLLAWRLEELADDEEVVDPCVRLN